jgi:hypothetical protein
MPNHSYNERPLEAKTMSPEKIAQAIDFMQSVETLFAVALADYSMEVAKKMQDIFYKKHDGDIERAFSDAALQTLVDEVFGLAQVFMFCGRISGSSQWRKDDRWNDGHLGAIVSHTTPQINFAFCSMIEAVRDMVALIDPVKYEDEMDLLANHMTVQEVLYTPTLVEEMYGKLPIPRTGEGLVDCEKLAKTMRKPIWRGVPIKFEYTDDIVKNTPPLVDPWEFLL